MYLNFNKRKIVLLIFNHLINVMTIKILRPIHFLVFNLKSFPQVGCHSQIIAI